jgi:hypothetical protein
MRPELERRSQSAIELDPPRRAELRKVWLILIGRQQVRDRRTLPRTLAWKSSRNLA